MPNRLADESSPYLLQHAHNPVDWQPWGPEALARAKAEQKPIFLSIGYSACHWCHVMEHESFEDPRIAALMNEHYICIKVDREERPDLDQIYMQAVQMMTGRGGWPMSVFLTPDLQPFYGGTYWPPTARMGMPGFDQILAAVQDAWQNRRPQALAQAQELTAHLQPADSGTDASAPRDAGPGRPARNAEAGGDGTSLDRDLLVHAGVVLERAFDFRHGGFGGAPKFPHPMDLRLLLRIWRRAPRDGVLQMATQTLDKMAAGGIYDQLGGGFHRYSVDDRWLVPHFEKMLYDNALLTSAYVEAFQATRNPEYARIARETCDYVLRDLTDPAGGFYSTEDADSEGHEGKFYVWTPAEIQAALEANTAELFEYVYDVSPAGNFEGQNILNLPKTLEQVAQLKRLPLAALRDQMSAARDQLRRVRNQRVRPGRDDKVLVNWNSLMIDALSQAAGPLGEPRYATAAARAADFILQNLRRPDGRLLHTWRGGRAKQDAFLDDYAGLVNALVSVYEATFEPRHVDAAVQLADALLAHFKDDKSGGFYFTANDHERLIARQKDWQDSSVPSGNALAATGLLRLGKLTGRGDYLEAARQTLAVAAPLMKASPSAGGQLLLALDMLIGPTPELVFWGEFLAAEMQQALADLHQRYLPNKIVAARSDQTNRPEPSPHLIALFAGKQASSQPALYVCEHFSCQEPSYGLASIRARLEGLAPSVLPRPEA